MLKLRFSVDEICVNSRLFLTDPRKLNLIREGVTKRTGTSSNFDKLLGGVPDQGFL